VTETPDGPREDMHCHDRDETMKWLRADERDMLKSAALFGDADACTAWHRLAAERAETARLREKVEEQAVHLAELDALNTTLMEHAAGHRD